MIPSTTITEIGESPIEDTLFKLTFTFPLTEDTLFMLTFAFTFFLFTAELGDYNQEDHVDGYLAQMRFVPNQTDEFEKEVMELHKQHRYSSKQQT